MARRNETTPYTIDTQRPEGQPVVSDLMVLPDELNDGPVSFSAAQDRKRRAAPTQD